MTDFDPALAKELDDANAEFSAAYLARDAETLIAAYTEDAVILTPESQISMTPEAVRQVWEASSVREPPLGHSLNVRTRQMLAPDLVLEIGDWRIGRNVDGEPRWTKGVYTLIWRNTSQGWRMQYDTWTPPMETLLP